MSVLWHKVWHDLWRNKARTLLAVFSIAAGVFAVGGIFGLIDQLLVTMDRSHQAVAPSHVSIILRNFVTQEVVDELAQTPGVAGIDPVNQLSVRYRTEPDAAWKLGTVMERPDYTQQTFDMIRLQEGAWPAEERIAVERLTSQHFNVALGQTVTFEKPAPSGGGASETIDLEVAGVIRHPFVQPPNFGGQAHFFVDAQALEQFGIPQDRFGQLLVQVTEPYSLQKAQEVAGELRSRLADQGYGVIVSLYQDPDKHWGRQFVEGVNLILRIMAVVSLFMSVVLVLTTITALITQQTDQIGVIKAVGGRRGVIIRLYLAVALIYGALALLIALPAGALFAFFMARWQLNLFNIDYSAFRVSVSALLLQVATAFVAPVLAALWPVLKGSALSVREAIATYGLGGDFKFSRFRGLDAVRRAGERLLPTPVAAALGNMFRHTERLTLTILVLTVGGVMFLVIMSLISSTTATLDNELARRGYDVRIGFARSQDAEEVQRLAEEVAGVTAAETWYTTNATILRQGERLQDSAGLGAQLTGIPVDADTIRPIVVEGRWLRPDDQAAVVLSQETAEKNGIAVGDTVVLDLGSLGDAPWQVVGLYRVVYGGGYVTEPIYAPLSAVAEATGQTGQATQVLVRTAPQTLAEITAIADELKTAFEDTGRRVDFYTTSIKLEERDFATNQFNTVVWMLLGLASLVATVGGIGLAGSLGISVVERTREIGVMRAIGARSGTLTGLFMMEGLLQGLISWLLAVPISFVVAQPLARLLGQTMIDVNLDFVYNGSAVLIWLGATVAIAALFSIGPARNATRISVRQALAYS